MSENVSNKRKTDETISQKQSAKKTKQAPVKNEKKRKIPSSSTPSSSSSPSSNGSNAKKKIKKESINNLDSENVDVVPDENLNPTEDSPIDNNTDTYDTVQLQEKKNNFSSHLMLDKKNDFYTTVIDQISLEGLDGITLEGKRRN